MENRLPDKLSDLISLALKDLETVERNPKYKVDMGRWHEPIQTYDGSRYCSVCFAGAVMAITLNTSHRFDVYSPSYFDADTREKLICLDNVRQYSCVSDAYGGLVLNEAYKKLAIYKNVAHIGLENYGESPVEFKKNMQYIADQLKEGGY